MSGLLELQVARRDDNHHRAVGGLAAPRDAARADRADCPQVILASWCIAWMHRSISPYEVLVAEEEALRNARGTAQEPRAFLSDDSKNAGFLSDDAVVFSARQKICTVALPANAKNSILGTAEQKKTERVAIRTLPDIPCATRQKETRMGCVAHGTWPSPPRAPRGDAPSLCRSPARRLSLRCGRRPQEREPPDHRE